jgi:hypothetical protein
VTLPCKAAAGGAAPLAQFPVSVKPPVGVGYKPLVRAMRFPHGVATHRSPHGGTGRALGAALLRQALSAGLIPRARSPLAASTMSGQT